MMHQMMLSMSWIHCIYTYKIWISWFLMWYKSLSIKSLTISKDLLEKKKSSCWKDRNWIWLCSFCTAELNGCWNPVYMLLSKTGDPGLCCVSPKWGAGTLNLNAGTIRTSCSQRDCHFLICTKTLYSLFRSWKWRLKKLFSKMNAIEEYYTICFNVIFQV